MWLRKLAAALSSPWWGRSLFTRTPCDTLRREGNRRWFPDGPLAPAVWYSLSPPVAAAVHSTSLLSQTHKAVCWGAPKHQTPVFFLTKEEASLGDHWLYLKAHFKQTYKKRLTMETVLCPLSPCPLSVMIVVINTINHAKCEMLPQSSAEWKLQMCLLWYKQSGQRKQI